MKTFNDADEWQAAIRLADLREVADRVRRLGIPDVDIDYDGLMLRFRDPRVRGTVNLEILPWSDGEPGWYWHADIQLPGGFSIGPLTRRCRVLANPYPRLVVRAYQQDIWWEMRPPRKKMNKHR